MKHKLLRAFYAICLYLGIIRLFYFINRNKQQILVFHHIIPDEMANGSFEQRIVCSTQSHFAWLLAIINKRFHITTALGIPSTAVITFDDGYRAALTAKTELDKYGNKAYFFVPISVVDGGPLWIDYIMGWFAYAPAGRYTVKGFSFDIDSQQSRHMAFSSIVDSLYLSGSYNFEDIIAELESQYSNKYLGQSPDYFGIRFEGLRDDEITLLKNEGHKIAGHSVRHDILSLLSPSALQSDFEQCFAQIGTLYNSTLYAYPFGHKRDVSCLCIKTCSESRFNSAVMNEYVAHATPYSISRLNISGYKTRAEVEAALSGFTRWLKKFLK